VVLGSGLTSLEQTRLAYRGLDAVRLAAEAPFEAVADWLWLGEEPPASPEPGSWHPWEAGAESLAAARHALRALPPATSPADMLRVAATVVGPTDPLRFDLSPHSVARTGRRLIATLVDALPSRASTPASPLRVGGSPPLADALASRLWERLTSEPGTGPRTALANDVLVLLADHGLASSTLAARVAASVRADPCSVVAAGLGTLAGPLHGAASALVHRLFADVGHADRAVAVVGDFLRRERLMPGFGHLIYEGWDPRARRLHDTLRTADLDPGRVEVVERVLEILLERVEVRPNVDFFIGAITWSAGMPETAGEALFGVARAAGWIAHALEEYEEAPLRFRPRAHYVGPPARDPRGA
jgi:citrate synthase